MKLLYIGTVLAVFSTITIASTTSAQANIPKVITKHIQPLIDDDRFQAVSVGVHFNGVSTRIHAGQLAPQSGQSANDKTLFEVASITKPLLGFITAQAVLEGKVELDEDINVYFKQDFKNLSPEKSPLTIKHLLTHTSGLPTNPQDLNVHYSAMTKKDLLKAIDKSIYQRDRGQYSYSNIAPQLLAAILEEVYQEPFEQLFKRNLHKAANIKDIHLTLQPRDKARFAYGYNDKQQPMKAFDGAPQFWGAAGRAKATLPDLMRFIGAQLDRKNQVALITHQQLLKTGSGGGIGYFWQRISGEDGVYLQHHGGLFGSQNWMIVYPEYNLGISIIANVSFPGVGELLKDAADAIVNDIKPFGKKSIKQTLKSLCQQRVTSCISKYHQLKKEALSNYNFGDENELNELGYYLLAKKNSRAAISVFHLLVSEFPRSSNPYDSLAEGYLVNGNQPCALKYYQQTLKMNRTNAHATRVVSRLLGDGVSANKCER